MENGDKCCCMDATTRTVEGGKRMDDLISRQAAIDVASRECREWRGIFSDIEQGLKELPSAQKTGKWIEDINKTYVQYFICNQCGNEYRVGTCMGKPIWNFCPNCGADMREGGE